MSFWNNCGAIVKRSLLISLEASDWVTVLVIER